MKKLKKEKQLKNNKGITLIALVITIIVLLILAGVSIAMLTGQNGILTQAQRAKNATENASANEQSMLDSYEDYMNGITGGQWQEEKGVNSPQLMQGMTEVSFKLPDDTNKGEIIKRGDADFDENNWYNYEKSEWANAVTQDGSYWVWIPRFAYKITHTDKEDKSKGGTIDVKFLIGTSDNYYDDEGNIQTAKRAKSKDEEVDTTKDYYVHPVFTDESSIGYANGGWDEEIPGIWVAKFEAGYASGNNNAPKKASNVSYSKSKFMENNEEIDAKNWLDGEYGSATTAIKYPTFQPITYSMNYISINDAYNVSRALTDSGNIYGLISSSTDSHLIKNSEWGAVIYLAYSKYGAGEEKIYDNNLDISKSIQNLYAVTGITTGKKTEFAKVTEQDIKNINNRNENVATNGIYAWDQLEGQKASSTLNMYGVYDLGGGLWEDTAGYINNGHKNLSNGASVVVGGDTSTKYETVYPYKSPENSDVVKARSDNYKENKYIFGDAIRETSESGTGHSSWYNTYSIFPNSGVPFIMRGAVCWSTVIGLSAFHEMDGDASITRGFRPILIAN